MTGVVARLVAGVLLAAPVLAAPALAAPPALASSGPQYCTEADGVTVIVDLRDLDPDAGVLVRCAEGAAGGTGFDALGAAGLAYAMPARFPGMVCRLATSTGPRPSGTEEIPVAGDEDYVERCAGAPPTKAYWSYWYAPEGGTWRYSSSGPANRETIAGGFEGWSFSLNRSQAAAPAPRLAPDNPNAPYDDGQGGGHSGGGQGGGHSGGGSGGGHSGGGSGGGQGGGHSGGGSGGGHSGGSSSGAQQGGGSGGGQQGTHPSTDPTTPPSSQPPTTPAPTASAGPSSMPPPASTPATTSPGTPAGSPNGSPSAAGPSVSGGRPPTGQAPERADQPKAEGDRHAGRHADRRAADRHADRHGARDAAGHRGGEQRSGPAWPGVEVTGDVPVEASDGDGLPPLSTLLGGGLVLGLCTAAAVVAWRRRGSA